MKIRIVKGETSYSLSINEKSTSYDDFAKTAFNAVEAAYMHLESYEHLDAVTGRDLPKVELETEALDSYELWLLQDHLALLTERRDDRVASMR